MEKILMHQSFRSNGDTAYSSNGSSLEASASVNFSYAWDLLFCCCHRALLSMAVNCGVSFLLSFYLITHTISSMKKDFQCGFLSIYLMLSFHCLWQ
ncbi:hypothetical protein NC652_023925 [Populus alba x Populus x berolinensis]|nr:hypothetical protein NC652_023925 [Populus alba x Populus x berolinensis]